MVLYRGGPVVRVCVEGMEEVFLDSVLFAMSLVSQCRFRLSFVEFDSEREKRKLRAEERACEEIICDISLTLLRSRLPTAHDLSPIVAPRLLSPECSLPRRPAP